MEQQNIHSRSHQSRLLNLVLRIAAKPALTSGRFDPARAGQWLERLMSKRKTAADIECNPLSAGTVKGEWQRPRRPISTRVSIMYIHGGGYFMGSARAYRAVTTHLARLASAPLFSVDYRLAPDHPFPAAVEDVVAAYHWLLQQKVDPRGLIVAGDSAGGGLCLALMHALQQEGAALPARLVLFSPWADLTATSASLADSRGCVLFDADTVRNAASYYLRGGDATSPLASPLYGEFGGFPPMNIYVSDSETIRDDSWRLAQKAEQAGVEVKLNIWHQQVHAWPVFYPLLPEAGLCLEEVADLAKELEEEINPVVVPLKPRSQRRSQRPGA